MLTMQAGCLSHSGWRGFWREVSHRVSGKPSRHRWRIFGVRRQLASQLKLAGLQDEERDALKREVETVQLRWHQIQADTVRDLAAALSAAPGTPVPFQEIFDAALEKGREDLEPLLLALSRVSGQLDRQQRENFSAMLQTAGMKANT